MMTEVMGQAQDPCHVTTAHFGGRFPDLAVELACFFDDEHARLGPFAFEHERCRGAGKSAADDYDVAFETHRNNRMDLPVPKGNSIAQRWPETPRTPVQTAVLRRRGPALNLQFQPE